jgi:hypothetical protein
VRKDKEIEKAVMAIIEEYDRVLKNAARRSLIVPESRLPHSKEAIKKAIRAALSAVDEQDKREQLKSAYVSLANFVSDKEARELEKIPPGLFSFLEMAEDKKKEFLRERFKSGLLGDYEHAMKITRKVAGEQKRLRKEMEKFKE